MPVTYSAEEGIADEKADVDGKMSLCPLHMDYHLRSLAF